MNYIAVSLVLDTSIIIHICYLLQSLISLHKKNGIHMKVVEISILKIGILLSPRKCIFLEGNVAKPLTNENSRHPVCILSLLSG